MNLRELNNNLTDLEFLLSVRNDDTTRNNLENNSLFSIEDTKKWYSTLKTKWLIIEVDGVSVGYIRKNEDGDIGIDIHPNYRKKGYARKAYLEYLKNVSYATLWVFEDNFAKNLYQEIGFIENGEYKFVRNRKYIKMIYDKSI